MGRICLAEVVGMVMGECGKVGLIILAKAIMSDGMSNLVLIFYTNTVASLILLPCSFLFHRSQCPALTPSILCGLFLLGLLGFSAQILLYAGTYYSSPTLGTAIRNLIPGTTFVLAIIFRMEKLDLKSSITIAKSMGTIVLITGAFIMIYCGGPPLLTSSTSKSSLQLYIQQSNWVIGGLLLATECLFSSAWLIVQASILKKFPAEMALAFFYCFFVAIQSAILGLAVERNPSEWSLKPYRRLIVVLYAGAFGSAFQVSISAWCLHRAGPLFVALFKPLGIVIAAAVGIIFSKDTFYLGSFIGAVVIVTGFYSVMWAKAKEDKMGVDTEVRNLESCTQKSPLLQSNIEDA